jgi:hypothetical protein
MESRLSCMDDAMYETGIDGNPTAQIAWTKVHDPVKRKALCMSYVGGTGPDGAVPLKVDGLAGLFEAALAKQKEPEPPATLPPGGQK